MSVQAGRKVAETYLEEGNENLAEPHLRNVIEHDGENQYGYTDKAMFALGFALGKRGEYAQAAYSFEKRNCSEARWYRNTEDRDKALYCLGLSQLAVGTKGQRGRALAAGAVLVKEFLRQRHRQERAGGAGQVERRRRGSVRRAKLKHLLGGRALTVAVCCR